MMGNALLDIAVGVLAGLVVCGYQISQMPRPKGDQDYFNRSGWAAISGLCAGVLVAVVV